VGSSPLRDLAIEPKKRELFDRLAEHHKVLVAEIERAIAESKNQRVPAG
jgi:hypothetical protein